MCTLRKSKWRSCRVGLSTVLMAGLLWSFSVPSVVMGDTPGTPLAWGGNDQGQLGDGTEIDRLTPVSVSGLFTATGISAGGNDGWGDGRDPGTHSLALADDGTVFAWGLNDYGQLGDDTQNSANTPVAVSGLTDVTAVAAGGYHSLALTSDGTIWAWGDNWYGQLGFDPVNGAESIIPIEVELPGDVDAVAIAAGGLHSLALDVDGTVWAWGSNLYSQLGDGTAIDSYEPVQVTGLDDANVVAIAAGAYHNLALDDDGTVRAWGLNGDGQLGDDSFDSSNAAIPVEDVSGVTVIAAGGDHSVALRVDGAVVAWGLNASGQLGDDTTDSSSVPVEVEFPVDVVAAAISAGENHTLSIGVTSPSPDTLMEGDVTGDGQTNIVDAMFVAQYTVGLREFTDSQMICGDTTDDGMVNIVDAMHIAQFTVDPTGEGGVLFKDLWASPADDGLLNPLDY